MPTSTLADVALTGAWQNLVVTHPTAGSAATEIQNVGPTPVAIVVGGADPTAAGKSGRVLKPGESITGTADAIWAKAIGNQGKVAVGLASGHSQYGIIAQATTNANVIKASAGKVFGYSISNISGAARYVKLYNKATAPNLAADIPVRRICIPAGQTVQYYNDCGLEGFTAGIAIAAVTGVLDNDATATALGDLVISVDYR